MNLPRKSSHTWLKLEDGELAPVSVAEMKTVITDAGQKPDMEQIQGRTIMRIWNLDQTCTLLIQLFENETADNDISLMELF